jgi:hypothetical protein
MRVGVEAGEGKLRLDFLYENEQDRMKQGVTGA